MDEHVYSCSVIGNSNSKEKHHNTDALARVKCVFTKIQHVSLSRSLAHQ